MKELWPYSGARWWKFDFHTHTPASLDTRAWQVAIGTSDEMTPQTWLRKYMAAEIDCVAVTDHNTGDWIDKLKTTYAEMKCEADAGTPPDGFRELHVFPGVEISVQSGFHLLAIFDPSANSQTISDLLAQVDYSGTRGDSDGVTRIGAALVIEKVIAAGAIAIPAHVEGEKGLLQLREGTNRCLIDTNTVKDILQEPGILALEWTAANGPKPAILDELKLRFASVVGSDCHSFRGTAVPGTRYTWVKMAKPSLEGLRLALLDGQDVSVRRSDESNGFAPFKTPEHFIESIEISNARYMGRGATPVNIQLNPYFNALIGGRGTGKSSIVHAVRLAYRRERELLPNSESEQTFSRFNKVPRNSNDEGGLREDTSISLQVNRDGSSYLLRWQRNGRGHSVEQFDTGLNCFIPSESQAVTEQRFPLRLFSQGQIASLAGDSQESLLKVIDDAAGTQTQQAAFEEAKRAFWASRAQMYELDSKLKGIESLKLALEDVKRKLSRFEVSNHASVLKNYQLTSSQARELDRQFEISVTLATDLKTFATDICAEKLPDELFDLANDHAAVTIVQQLHAAITKAQQDILNSAASLLDRAQDLRNELNSSNWYSGIGSAKYAYEQLKADLQEQGVSDPSEYGRLVQEKQRFEGELAKLEALQKQHSDLRQKAKLQLEQVQVARRAVSTQRSTFLQETLRDNPFVRIELIPYSRDAQGIDRSLREVLCAPDGKYLEDIYQEQPSAYPKGLVADLLGSVDLVEQPGSWDSVTFEEALFTQKKRILQACRGEGEFGSWFNKFLKAEADKRQEYTDQVLCWFPEDGLQVEYSRKGDGRDFQSIGQASAGQRAAAMLAFLLAHGSEPLVLDQPEDDLDNHLIYGLVVQQIRSNKLRRQLIIVTHNPNIVVNGDAELIHVLDFNHQCFIKQTGSLQDQTMRREVCQVMEGGEEAFERRYQRLGREV